MCVSRTGSWLSSRVVLSSSPVNRPIFTAGWRSDSAAARTYVSAGHGGRDDARGRERNKQKDGHGEADIQADTRDIVTIGIVDMTMIL